MCSCNVQSDMNIAKSTCNDIRIKIQNIWYKYMYVYREDCEQYILRTAYIRGQFIHQAPVLEACWDC